MSTKPIVATGWEVPGIRRATEFFSALPEILPLPVQFCLEGTTIRPDVQALLTPNAVLPTLEIPRGTIWPKPSVFHVLATKELIRGLATLAERRAAPEICDHFHVYKDGRGLMQWYDAFDLPLLIDESVGEMKLRDFCRRLGVHYSQWHAK